MAAATEKIKHLVVLMMSNRSFDHMLGFMKSTSYPVDGLNGHESNLDSEGQTVTVSNDATHQGDFTPDPGHSLLDTLTQVYGDPKASLQMPSMNGFVRSYEQKTHDRTAAHRIMKCFSPQNLPVLTTLAQQFAVCDRWFSSVPGPAFPNRAFAHAGTSTGRVDMSVNWTTLPKTIFELLTENEMTSRIYFHDSTIAMTYGGLANKPRYFATFDSFVADCAANTLPAYSFLEPLHANLEDPSGRRILANDQHPDHDVTLGESLIRTVFDAVWSNPDVRNSTLLAIVYDSHGGLYDHVPPPSAVSPDGKAWTGNPDGPDPPFAFTSLGPRVPAVLVSPYIPAGTIDRTIYDHTSLIATARKLFLPEWESRFLTLRDKAAISFDHLLSLPEPRSLQLSFSTPVSRSRSRTPADSSLKTSAAAFPPPNPVSGINTSSTPTPPTPAAIGTYIPSFSPEDLTGEDRLGIREEVFAFASVMAAQNLHPPLAIGLFGDWGSGKSFFMRKLKERIEHIAGASDAAQKQGKKSSYCNKIVQIEFNAWHYAEGNLWASIVEHIFENLRLSSGEPPDLVKERKAKALESTELAKEVKAQAQQKLLAAEAEQAAAKSRLDSATSDRTTAANRLSVEELVDVWEKVQIPANLKAQIATAMNDLGFTPFADSAKELHAAMADTKSLLGRAHAVLLSMFNAPGWQKRVLLLVLIVLAVPAIGMVAAAALQLAGLQSVKDQFAKAAQAATLLAGIATWFREQTKKASNSLRTLENANRVVDTELAKVRESQEKTIARLEKELAEARQKVTEATNVVAEADAKVAVAQAQLNAATPTRIMAEFIEARAASTDYRRHLGIVALIRKDFETLTQLLRQRRDESRTLGVDDILGIDRIILYIDDLDRCPPTKVVQVLEAIHLLLAFDLFVVVVGVDSRWVSRSLLHHYSLLSPPDGAQTGNANYEHNVGGATPLDYLEKIFQIPFWLRTMPPDACKKLIDGIVGPGVQDTGSATSSSTQTVGPTQPVLGTVVGLSSSAPTDPGLVANSSLTGTTATHGTNAQEPVQPQTLESLDLEAKSLQLESQEVEFMKTLASILSRSPRATKRFINTYRIVRGTLPRDMLFSSGKNPAQCQGMGYQAVMFLLSILTGALPVADTFFDRLCGQPRTATLAELSSDLQSSVTPARAGEAKAICDWLSGDHETGKSPMSVELLQSWSRYVSRFSFRMDMWSGALSLSAQSSQSTPFSLEPPNDI